MNKNQIAKKYSRAIVNTVNIAEIPQLIEEMMAFAQLLEENRQLKLFFAGKIFSDTEREKAFAAILPSLKFSAGTEKFLRLIIVHGHLSAIKEIISASMNVYNDRQKKATALVVSPVSLGASYAGRLKAALKNLTDREIEIENEVDPSLLGGFVVRVGSTIYDSSVKGQLRLLKAELTR